MAQYRMVFLVEQGSLVVLMSVLDKEKSIQLVEMDLVKEETGEPAKRKHKNSGPRLHKNMHGDVLLAELTKGGVAVSREQLTEAMVKNGFKATGLSPLVSRGIKKKIVAWDKEGKLRRAVKGG